jgi:phenylalanyl-tRNA synthetase beta chain
VRKDFYPISYICRQKKVKENPRMTISYKWISEYIPVAVDPEKISKILTSIGLEVESMEPYQSIKGGLEGLVVGEVKESKQHPGADKLKLTKVDIGTGELLQIVCGAPNVAAGQKVIVALPGTTIYPLKGDPLTLKKAKIRGEESFGMICAEDEIGIGESHDGIVVLPAEIKVGSAVSEYYQPYTDWIYEIGLTPNRMDAMSHWGVARDVCAYLRHHDKKDITVRSPFNDGFITVNAQPPFVVSIENTRACKRYTGVLITNIQVKESPKWLQEKLRSIGQRPINNIVDITNFVLHDTGQPLHAFDADQVKGNKIIVKNLPEGTVFKTLDGKERKLSSEDLMICDGEGTGMCIAGVFGGADSGVQQSTKNIFLESAWFNPVDIRRTSFRHGLRTDAATRFEKNVDISNTLNVLKRAAMMIAEIGGGEVSSAVADAYPSPEKKSEVELQYDFLNRLSGKHYEKQTVKNILQSLGFEVIAEKDNSIRLAVPFSKPDIAMQADVVEEVMRIDGYDNIMIPTSITITPSVGAGNPAQTRREKTANYLVGAGFSEIFTNSITNAAYFEDAELNRSVRLLNNLSAVHNIMRPSMLETGLESVAYNLNRKNSDLKFFEFGKTYEKRDVGKYIEREHLCLYITGSRNMASWKDKAQPADVYYLKGVVSNLLGLLDQREVKFETGSNEKLRNTLLVKVNNETVAELGVVSKHELNRFDIKQEVLFADIQWKKIFEKNVGKPIAFVPLPNQLPVYRDLAMVVPKALAYQDVETTIAKIRLEKLRSLQLFDVFESEKLGHDKKSLAVSFMFQDDEKTLTDREIDAMMSRIMRTLEQDLSAEIRKGN